jgi:ubiquinone/menaquinone biosynthesis C-methylase UbiE
MDAFKQALGSIPGGWVLDVATGEGEFAATLAGNLGSYAQIVGIDVLEYGQHEESIFCAEDVHFLQMDAGRLGFEDASLDTVSISSSLHHLQDVPRCLGEMVRVLKPGARWINPQTQMPGLSQRRLAEETGVSQTQLHAIIKKGHSPGSNILIKFADFFGANPLSLFAVAYLGDGGEAVFESGESDQMVIESGFPWCAALGVLPVWDRQIPHFARCVALLLDR